MIAVTSIAPKHINSDIQSIAVNSWLKLGLKVYSFNSMEECKVLGSQYPEVHFVPTNRTMEHHFGKPYVALNAIFDWCKEQKENHICLINSDIELRTTKEIIARIEKRMDREIVLANRVDYNDKIGSQYLAGIDVFFIHREFLPIFPQSVYCLGQCHFDYWIPFTAVKAGVSVIFVKQDIAYHKAHNAQYNNDMWMKTGRYFLWENSLYQFSDTNGIGKMSTYVYNYIYNASKREQV